MVTTIHAYTASQSLIDRPTRKRCRGRAAAASLIPTSTGEAKATAIVIPELKRKMDAIAVRAPIPYGALTDIVAHLKKDVFLELIPKVNLLVSESAKIRKICRFKSRAFKSRTTEDAVILHVDWLGWISSNK